MHSDVIMAGSGGQGILMIGDLLALAALREGRHVTWMPSYGVEMRGGTANCTIVISSEPIGSPITAHPHHVVVMNRPSLEKFEPMVRKGGTLVLNETFIERDAATRKDIDVIPVPTSEVAQEIGDNRLASMVALGAFNEKAQLVKHESLITALEETLPAKRRHMLDMNKEALERGRAFGRNGA